MCGVCAVRRAGGVIGRGHPQRVERGRPRASRDVGGGRQWRRRGTCDGCSMAGVDVRCVLSADRASLPQGLRRRRAVLRLVPADRRIAARGLCGRLGGVGAVRIVGQPGTPSHMVGERAACWRGRRSVVVVMVFAPWTRHAMYVPSPGGGEAKAQKERVRHAVGGHAGRASAASKVPMKEEGGGGAVGEMKNKNGKSVARASRRT